MTNKTEKNTTLSEHFQKPTKKNIERGKIDTLNTQIYDHLFSWLGTGTSIKVAGLS
jgi:hypothetical protein